MITKEKLQNGYILNDKGVLRQKFVDVAKFHGFDTDWMDGVIGQLMGEYIFIDEKDIVDGGSSRYLHPLQKELTLEDFNESPKNDTGSVSKWKYKPIEIGEYLFGLKDKYFNGELYVLYEGEHLKVENQTQLAEGYITNTLYTREEIKWGRDVLNYLSNKGKCSYPVNGLVHNSPEIFLEAARISLRSTGELK